MVGSLRILLAAALLSAALVSPVQADQIVPRRGTIPGYFVIDGAKYPACDLAAKWADDATVARETHAKNQADEEGYQELAVAACLGRRIDPDRLPPAWRDLLTGRKVPV